MSAPWCGARWVQTIAGANPLRIGQSEPVETSSVPRLARSRVGRVLPGRELAGYQRGWLPKDIVAGLVLSALLVPQGMAYAELAGLPAVTGLYTSVLCLVAYAIFGPSKVLVLGPDSSPVR